MNTPSPAASGRNLADFDVQQSAPGVPAPTDAELAEAWFDATPASARRPSVPPTSVVGEFLGDELADGWLR
ncbi:MAG TPA: hypothetical protein VLT33_47075 [Labilithrix sp.]|nr:hypothetical protein [Labilithrix sp.]